MGEQRMLAVRLRPPRSDGCPGFCGSSLFGPITRARTTTRTVTTPDHHDRATEPSQHQSHALGVRSGRGRNPTLSVAACNHRAFCSQTSAVSAQIILRMTEPEYSRSLRTCSQYLRRTCNHRLVLTFGANEISSGRNAGIAQHGAEFCRTYRARSVAEKAPDFRRVRIEPLSQRQGG